MCVCVCVFDMIQELNIHRTPKGGPQTLDKYFRVVYGIMWFDLKFMSVTGAQIEFKAPEKTDFKRVYDYQIRKISLNYSIDDGLSWYPCRPIVPVSGEDSIAFSTQDYPIELITYTTEDATDFHPALKLEDTFKLEFEFEMFSKNDVFKDNQNGERVYHVRKRNSNTYSLSEPANPIYRIDPETGFPVNISIVIGGFDVYKPN